MSFLAIRPRSPRDEAGLTLIELGVVVLILGIMSAVMFDFLNSTTSITARATSSVAKENDARIAMREVTQDVRAANKILSTYPTDGSACPAFGDYPMDYKNCLRFEIQRSVDATQACPKSVITYGIRNGKLLRTRTDYAANCTTMIYNGSGDVVIDSVTNGAMPLFEFFNGANQQITSTAFADKPLYQKAASIRVNLSLRYKTNAPDFKITSAVALRNNR